MDSFDNVKLRYAQYIAQNLNLDMTRGKPCKEQLDLSLPMLSLVGPQDYLSEDGTDIRNYGGLDGLTEAKQLFAKFLEVGVSEIIIGGNSSLNLMHDTIHHALLHGRVGQKPWVEGKAKFICPSPGYDRHFSICEHHDIEMINVDNDQDGPDMEEVERLVAHDASVKGIWIVPKYGNPSGSVCSDDVVRRLARMKTAAPDFTIMWDNAYVVHHLNDSHPDLLNILEACKEAGNPDRVFIYGSTSKITFAGAGIAMMGGSEANMAWMRKHMAIQTIGSDKINQLRHTRFFSDIDAIHHHMKAHAAILKPKFDAVLEILEREIGQSELATWTKPQGGYFISLNTRNGMAKRVVELAAKAGVKLTNAGASFPYGQDPLDRNIRIAPSLPSLVDIKKAIEILALCIHYAALEKLD